MMAEPGADTVQAALSGAIMSAVNVSEVIARLVDRDSESQQRTFGAIQDLGVQIVPFDSAQAFVAGKLRSVTRSAGLSLGDRACLALAKTRGAPALTADREWRNIAAAAQVEVITIR
jgi:PIN domain nuclease of toxin-antitoxin system